MGEVEEEESMKAEKEEMLMQHSTALNILNLVILCTTAVLCRMIIVGLVVRGLYFYTSCATSMHLISNLSYLIITAHQRGYTALLRAARHGHAKIATLLLEMGANSDYARKVSYCVCIEIVLEDEMGIFGGSHMFILLHC
jgi:hypothetical protein